MYVVKSKKRPRVPWFGGRTANVFRLRVCSALDLFRRLSVESGGCSNSPQYSVVGKVLWYFPRVSFGHVSQSKFYPQGCGGGGEQKRSTKVGWKMIRTKFWLLLSAVLMLVCPCIWLWVMDCPPPLQSWKGTDLDFYIFLLCKQAGVGVMQSGNFHFWITTLLWNLLRNTIRVVRNNCKAHFPQLFENAKNGCDLRQSGYDRGSGLKGMGFEESIPQNRNP